MKIKVYCYGNRLEEDIPLSLYQFINDKIIQIESEPTPVELKERIVQMSTGLRSFLVDGCLHPKIIGNFMIVPKELNEYVSQMELQIDFAKSFSPAEWVEHVAARYHINKSDVGVLICGIVEE